MFIRVIDVSTMCLSDKKSARDMQVITNYGVFYAIRMTSEFQDPGWSTGQLYPGLVVVRRVRRQRLAPAKYRAKVTLTTGCYTRERRTAGERGGTGEARGHRLPLGRVRQSFSSRTTGRSRFALHARGRTRTAGWRRCSTPRRCGAGACSDFPSRPSRLRRSRCRRS